MRNGVHFLQHGLHGRIHPRGHVGFNEREPERVEQLVNEHLEPLLAPVHDHVVGSDAVVRHARVGVFRIQRQPLLRGEPLLKIRQVNVNAQPGRARVAIGVQRNQVQQRTHAARVRLHLEHVQMVGLLVEFHEMQGHAAATREEVVGDGHTGFVQYVVPYFIRKKIGIVGVVWARQIPSGIHRFYNGGQAYAVTFRVGALQVRMQHAQRLAQSTVMGYHADEITRY